MSNVMVRRVYCVTIGHLSHIACIFICIFIVVPVNSIFKVPNPMSVQYSVEIVSVHSVAHQRNDKVVTQSISIIVMYETLLAKDAFEAYESLASQNDVLLQLPPLAFDSPLNQVG